MLYIELSKTNVMPQHVTIQWHVGEKNPLDHNEPLFVTEVQADGDELDYILYRIRPGTIPISMEFQKGVKEVTKPVQRWFGDHAKFIVANVIGG